MLFWLFVIALVVGVGREVLYNRLSDNCRYDFDWIGIICQIIIVISILAIITSGCLMGIEYIGADAYIAKRQETYESLTYQLENNLYDNDNDLGKKELYDDIQEWNEILAYCQKVQDDFWIGIYYADIYDQLEFIEYE